MKSFIATFLASILTACGQSQQPVVIKKTTVPHTYKLEWDSISGRSYFLQQSVDLSSWTYIPKVLAGVGGIDWMGVSSSSDRRFYRLVWSSLPTIDPLTVDHDGDGVPSFAELSVTHTDPLKFSTSGNGVSDRGLFPNPSNGIYIDTTNQIQYSLVPNPAGITSPRRIIAVSNFEAPDYIIQFKKGERVLEKQGYQPFISNSSNSMKRYLTLNKRLGATDLNGRVIQGVWQLGVTPAFGGGGKWIYATSNSIQTLSINPLTGVETTAGAPVYAFINNYIPPVRPWGWNEAYRHGVWYNPCNCQLYYDVVPIQPYPFWDAGGFLYYEETLINENTIANVGSTAIANPPGYPVAWSEGNPWAMYDIWNTAMGVTYSRLIFRVQNKNGVTNGEPVKACIFFTPKLGGSREELMTIHWSGQGQFSPEYTIDPGVLRPNIEGIFHASVGTVSFELDVGQVDNRKADQEVTIPIHEEDDETQQFLRFRKGISAANNVSVPSPNIKFPGMDDTWYEGATITITQNSPAMAGELSFIAVDPISGDEVAVPLGQNLAPDFFNSRGFYSGYLWKIRGIRTGLVTLILSYNKGSTIMTVERTARVVADQELLSDLNNDGIISPADAIVRDAAEAEGASTDSVNAGTEYLIVNDTLSNGIWDKEDTDTARPITENYDDDAEEIKIKPGITEGEVWLEHPAIAKLSFYKTRECNAADKVDLSPTSKFAVSASNPFPVKLFMRADVGGAPDYPDNDPQIAGDLVLKIKVGTNGQEIEAVKLKLIVVKDFGAKNYFQAANDYVLENNTELFVHEKSYGSVFFRLCLMREEGTAVLPLELYEPARENWIQAGSVGNFSAYTHREAAGISEVMINNPNMTVVINGNQCGFTSGLTSAEAAAMSALGDPQITDKCQGRLKELSNGQSPVSNDHFDENTNIPGTQMKGSALAGPDPLPSTTPPLAGGKYIAQYPDGKIVVGLNYAPYFSEPPNPSYMLTQMGGLSSSYSSSDRSNYNNSLVGTAPIGSTSKMMVFVIMGKNGSIGKGKTVELYNSAVSSGVPQISGATTPSGSSPPITMVFLDSGVTSCALAYKKPNGNLDLLYKGSKHDGSPYYTNTFLQFKSSKPRP